MTESMYARTGAGLLQRLHEVYGQRGPFSTVHVDVSRAAEDAAEQVGLRWRAALDALRDAGAPREHLDAVSRAAEQATDLPGDVQRTVVVNAEGILLDEQIPARTAAAGRAVFGTLPDAVPLLAEATSWVPYVIVQTQRAHAAVALRVAGRSGGVEREVEGEDFHMRKVRVGGWAHRRIQQHAEEVWEGNAEAVAEEVVRVLRRSRAQLVVVAGDVRARQALEAELNETGEVTAEVVGIDANTLPEGSSTEALDTGLQEALGEQERRRLDDVLDRLAQGVGRGDTGVEGVPAVVGALQQAKVDVLLLHPGGLVDQQLGALADAPWVATRAEEQPVEPLGDAPAGDTLARAAVLTNADVVVLEDPHPQLGDGAAAVLRWGS
jgi:hypothetical protein